MICEDYRERVFTALATLLATLETPQRMRPVYDDILSRVNHVAECAEVFMPIDLPVAVGSVHDLDDHVLVAAAAACTALWSGADLMDDVSDGDALPAWNIAPHQLALLYTNLLTTVPHLALAALDADLAPGAAAIGPVIARTLWEMSIGQFRDLESSSSVASTDDYLNLVQRKTGAEIAFFAALPPMLAGMDEQLVAAWRQFGMEYGCMAQVFSDIHATFAANDRNDLRNGKRTLPVVMTLDIAADDEKLAFTRELENIAHGDPDALTRAVSFMQAQGAAFKSLEYVELLRYRAAAAIPVAMDRLSRYHGLKRMIRCYSITGPRLQATA